MIIDGVLEREDHEFDASPEDDESEKVFDRQWLEYLGELIEGVQGRPAWEDGDEFAVSQADVLEIAMDLCAAATDLCGGCYLDLKDGRLQYERATQDLIACLQERIDHEHRIVADRVAKPWATRRAQELFSADYHAAIRAFNNRAAEPDEEIESMTTATPAKRKAPRKKAANAKETAVVLRLEKRLKWEGGFTVKQSGEMFLTAHAVTDSKLSTSFELPFAEGHEAKEHSFGSEAEAVRDSFQALTEWADDLAEQHPEEAARLREIRHQLNDQLTQILGNGTEGIPETQEQAEAKERSALLKMPEEDWLGAIYLRVTEEAYEQASRKERSQAYDEGLSIEDAIDRLGLTRSYGISVGGRAKKWESHLTYGGERLSAAAGKTAAEAFEAMLPIAKDWIRKAGQPAVIEPPPEFGEPIPVELNATSDHARDQSPAAVVDVSVDDIYDHPLNPRSDYRGIEEMAESMKLNGQLVKALGRWRFDQFEGEVELIAGHRRLRAARLAGLTTLRVRILDVDDATALELLGRDNEERDNFDAIAKARWYRSLLDARGCTQRELAERLQVSQGDIGNHLALLNLPDIWIERIHKGEITPTQARSLQPWIDRPAVLKVIERRWTEARTQHDPELTTQEFADLVDLAVNELTMTCKSGEWFSKLQKKGWISGRVLFTPQQIEEHREELDVVEVDGELRAFNVKRWFELHGKLQKEASEKAAKKSGAAGSKQDKKELTPAEKRARTKKNAEQLANRIRHYKVNWHQKRIVERMTQAVETDATMDSAVATRLLLYFACGPGGFGRYQELEDVIIKAAGKPRRKRHGLIARNKSLWDQIASIDSDSEPTIARNVLCEWLKHNPESSQPDLRARDVPAIAELLGVDFAKEWRLDEEFLQLHNKDQLLALMRDWKILADKTAAEKTKRSDLIASALRNDHIKRLPVPKTLR